MNLIKEADRLYSLLVRQESADENGLARCVTCGRVRHWRRQHLGHFMPRQHQSTRFDRKNTAVQCVECNTFHEGRQYDFSVYLDKTYGEGTAKSVRNKAMMFCKRSAFDLQYMIKEFKNELKCKKYLIR